jgi:hypothetical protein
LYVTLVEVRSTHTPGTYHDVFTMWDDVDMDHLGLDKFGLTKAAFLVDPDEVHVFNCFREDWEEECIRKEELANKLKFLKKYGGMEFNENGHCRIDKETMNFMIKGGDREFKALACRPSYDPHDHDEDDYDNMLINLDLLGLIYTYYLESPDPKIRIVTKPEDIDPNNEWNKLLPDKNGRKPGEPPGPPTRLHPRLPTGLYPRLLESHQRLLLPKNPRQVAGLSFLLATVPGVVVVVVVEGAARGR